MLYRGLFPCDLLFLTDSPSIVDYESGRPFSGEPGRLIEQLIEETSLRNHMAIGFASAIFCTPTKSDRSWRQPSKAEIKNCTENLDMVVQGSECTYVVRVGKIVQKIKFEGTTTVDIPYPTTMLLSGCNDSEAYKLAVCELSNIPPF